MSTAKRIILFSIIAILALSVVVMVWRSTMQTRTLRLDGGVSPFQLLQTLDDDGFSPTPETWDFQFPADHASHNQYRTEWWYFSGTLQNDSNKHFGIQFVVMRIGLAATRSARQSRWATEEIYAGLFSVSDPAGNGLRSNQRVSRSALGLAGTTTTPVRLWVENWRLEQIGTHGQAIDFGMHIATDDLTLNLELNNQQPLIDANKVRGSRPERGTPFQFYIQPQMEANGTFRIGEQRIAVTGMLSMEHAWGELPLPGSAVARDRFTLYLDDERVLICVRTHRVDGSGIPTTTGLLISHDESPIVLSNTAIALDPIEHWTSAASGQRYPIRWALRIPDQGIELELLPYWENQETTVWTPFWAGPALLKGPTAIAVGSGFMQLNGYEDQ